MNGDLLPALLPWLLAAAAGWYGWRAHEQATYVSDADLQEQTARAQSELALQPSLDFDDPNMLRVAAIIARARTPKNAARPWLGWGAALCEESEPPIGSLHIFESWWRTKAEANAAVETWLSEGGCGGPDDFGDEYDDTVDVES